MAAQNSSFQMFSGNDKKLNFTVTDGAGAAIDIGAASFRFALSKLDTTASQPCAKGLAIFTKIFIAGQIELITDGSDGKVRVVLVPADTEALKGDYYYELEMTLGALKTTVAFGPINIKLNLLT